MTKQKITLFALIAVLVLVVPLAVEGVRNTWVGVDCENLNEGRIAMCNDINSLNTRLIGLEPVSEIQLQITPDNAISINPVGEWVYVEGIVPYIVQENSVGMTVLTPEGEIVRGGGPKIDYDGRFVYKIRTDADEYTVIGLYPIVAEYNGLSSTIYLNITAVP